MKLHFEPNLDYQLQAVEAVCDLFRGQEICQTEFTVTMPPIGMDLFKNIWKNDLGVGNRLTLLDDELLSNLGDIQLSAPATKVASNSRMVVYRSGLRQQKTHLGADFAK